MGWMCKGEVPSTRDATIDIVEQVGHAGYTANPNRKPQCPWILEVTTNWPKDENTQLSSEEEEEEKVTRAEETIPYYQLLPNEK